MPKPVVQPQPAPEFIQGQKDYIIRKHGNKHHVYKKGDNGQPVGEALGKHRTRSQAVDQLRALYANESKGDKAAAGKPTSSEDYAVVPDPDKPSTWKMPIHDRKHLGLAIAALGSDSSAPHGHAADLSPEDRKQALSRIHARIGRLANDENDKADLHARLAKHGKKASMFGGDWSPLRDVAQPGPAIYDEDDGDDHVGSVFTPKLSQDDPRVNYDPMTGTKDGACANCAFFDADDAACRLVEGEIVASGWCDLWLRQLEADEKEAKPGLFGGLKSAFKRLFGGDTPLTDLASGFKTFGPDNQYWAAFYSNNAQDRDGEWFAQSAHDKAIERLDKGLIPMPKLDYWHSKAYHGEAFWVGREGHVVMAVGTFWPDEFSQAMKEYYVNSAPDDDLVSFGYFYPKSARIEGVYYDYAPFEISPLPSQVAANEWTGFASLEEFKEMAVSAQKRKELERRLGPALAKQLLAEAGAKSRALDQIETSFKELDQEGDIASDVKALKEAVLILAGQKGTKSPAASNDDVPMKRRGQPTKEDDMNDAEDEPETDEDEDEYFGRMKSQNASLKKQVRDLTRKLKAAKDDGGDDGDDGEDDGDDGDGEDDGDDGKDGKKATRRKSRTPERGLKQLATGYKAISDALGDVTKALVAINQKQTGLENGINQLAQEIYNPVPASRSPWTQVPPDDPAMAALAAKMQGGGNQSAPPNQAAEQIAIQDMAAFVGLPTAFQSNGNGRH